MCAQRAKTFTKPAQEIYKTLNRLKTTPNMNKTKSGMQKNCRQTTQ